MGKYDLPPGIQEMIIKYCYTKIKEVNHKFLDTNNVRKNFFLEVMYDRAVENMYSKDDYKLSDEDMQQIFLFSKATEDILLGFIEGRNELIGVGGEDNLVFKVKKEIEH